MTGLLLKAEMPNLLLAQAPDRSWHRDGSRFRSAGDCQAHCWSRSAHHVVECGSGAGNGTGRYAVIAAMLHGVKPSDPAMFVAVALLVILVALLASYLPARRAASVDPMVALRYE